jgi:hypothetical protein
MLPQIDTLPPPNIPSHPSLYIPPLPAPLDGESSLEALPGAYNIEVQETESSNLP